MKVFVLLSLLVLLSFVSNSSCQDSVSLSGVILDQSPRNFPWIDFEEGFVTDDRGFVFGNLDPITFLPDYSFGNSHSINGTVNNKTSFGYWWTPSPYTKTVNFNLTLTSTDNVTYSFSSLSYFPIDFQGFDEGGDDEYAADDSENHNFHFCAQVHAWFLYESGAYINIGGNDDIFVFVNNGLIVDLGGTHDFENASVQIDPLAPSLSISVGQNVSFHLFYCNRHTPISTLSIETNIKFFCPYTDWCGICAGSGQFCCNNQCDDNSKCTTDYCDIFLTPAQLCHNVQLSCTPSNLCVTSQCDSQSGFCVENSICTTGDFCVTESCNLNNGTCSPVSTVCDDGLGICTNKVCNSTTSQCDYIPINCDDGNNCTHDFCVPNVGCMHAASVPCVPENACSTGQCGETGCIFTPLDCTSSDPCTIYSCDNSTGCISTPPNCDDGDNCTLDYCISGVGCSHAQQTCDDGNPCSNDFCNQSTGCYSTPVNCYNGDNCTTQQCVVIGPNYNCIISPICPTSDVCSPAVCDPVTFACSYTTLNCNDNNLCTNDSCLSGVGCQNINIAPNTGDLCNPATCNPQTGQVSISPVNCDDSNPCTTDYCNTIDGTCGHNFNSFNCAVNPPPKSNDSNTLTFSCLSLLLLIAVLLLLA